MSIKLPFNNVAVNDNSEEHNPKHIVFPAWANEHSDQQSSASEKSASDTDFSTNVDEVVGKMAQISKILKNNNNSSVSIKNSALILDIIRK